MTKLWSQIKKKKILPFSMDNSWDLEWALYSIIAHSYISMVGSNMSNTVLSDWSGRFGPGHLYDCPVEQGPEVCVLVFTGGFI